MDSFEARVYLTKQLSSLTPSKQAAQQCAKFLLKHKDLQDDLYSVILESLDAADLNIRINIFQFLEELILYCQHDSQKPYISSIIKDMKLILTKILPPKPDTVFCETRLLTNLHAAYTILVNISKSCKFKNIKEYKTKYSSNLLTDMDRNRIELQLQFDETPLYTEKELPESIDSQLDCAWEFLLEKRRQSHSFLLESRPTENDRNVAKRTFGKSTGKMDRKLNSISFTILSTSLTLLKINPL
ncbi:hypothetical protein KL943_002905 [Ogataea angusta]|nr:hypothetical protein KL943_002905 [Ogataea angusta]